MLFVRPLTPSFIKRLSVKRLALGLVSGLALALLPYSAAAADSDSEPAPEVNLGDEAAEDSKPQISRHQPNVVLKRAQSLLHHMKLMDREDEVITLQAPDNFYGLYLPQAASAPQGGILILHDQQQHGHWPDLVGPLRDYLPQFGWSTLTIELPDPPKRQRAPRTDTPKPAGNSGEQETEQEKSTEQTSTDAQDADEAALSEDQKDNAGPATDANTINAETDDDIDNNAEPALPRLQSLPEIEATAVAPVAESIPTVDDIKEFQQQNRNRVLAAVDYLHSKNQYNLVIIGYGRGASWAIDYVHQQLDQDKQPKGLALITIDALPDAYNAALMNEQLVDISIPYLDLLQPTEFNRANAAQKRAAIMRRNNHAKYRQIITQILSSYDAIENPTNRRIRGWIMTNAGGTQVNIKQ